MAERPLYTWEGLNDLGEEVKYTDLTMDQVLELEKQERKYLGKKKAMQEISARRAPAQQAQEEYTGAIREGMDPEFARSMRTFDRPVPPTPYDVAEIGQKYNVSPEELGPQIQGAQADYQRQESMETGAAYSPAGTRAEYLAGEYAAGRGGEASQKIASAIPTEKDIMTQKRLEETARQREKYQTERNRIAGWRAAISQNKLTSDERLKIMNAKANNETDRLGLEIKIKKLENDLKSKANKTDPVTYQPMMTPEQVDATMEEIKQLRTNLSILEDFRGEYDGLIKEKGGIRPVTPAQPKATNDPLGIR